MVENPATQQGRRVTIADNEIDGFTSAVEVRGAFGHDEPRDYDAGPECEPTPLPCPHLEPVQANLVRVERNYLHNNAMKGGGYWVVVGGGGYVTVEGNVFEYNNHSIAADGRAYSGSAPHRDRLGRWMPLGGATGYVRHSAGNMR